MNIETAPLIAIVFVLCVVCQWVAWKVRLPAILFLLLTGIVAGPVAGLLQPEDLLGDLLFPFVYLSVAIILFEGSINLKFREIQGLHVMVRNMLSIGMLSTWIITALATGLFLDISWEVATLFGAIMVVTGPTVIAPILRTVRPTKALASILKWESIAIDPIGAALAVLIFEFIVAGGGQTALGKTLISFIQLVVLGSAIGCVCGYFFGLCLRYHLIPEFLHNIATLGLIFATFTIANAAQPETGLVTVTVFGIWLANMKDVDLEHILAFKETLSTLLISLLFIILAARLDFSNFEQLGLQAFLICIVVQFVARPVNVMLSGVGSSLNLKEKLFLACIAPRGIVAAAISSLFAIKLANYGYEDAVLLVPLTLLVIIFTVLLQSLTAVPLGRLLGVTLPDPDGFLIIGSNQVARTIARALVDHNFQVIVADKNRERIARARQENIPTYLGNPISEDASRNLGLQGIGKLLALSAQESENIAAASHYRDEFGKKNIFSLLTAPVRKSSFRQRAMPQLRGNTLFGENVSYPAIAELIANGAKMYTIKLQKKFSPEQFVNHSGDNVFLLFALDPKNHIHCFSKEIPLHPEKDWKILYLAKTQQESLS